MTPKTTLWKIEPHTQAKHALLRNYLNAWLPIMAFTEQRWKPGGGKLVLMDGFCGPGAYEDGEEGSPIIMLKAFLEHKMRDRITCDLVYIFIDEDQSRIDHLKTEVAALEANQAGGKFPANVSVQMIAGKYEDLFSSTLDALAKKFKRIAPTFAFIDPFGYTDASMGLTDRLLQFSRCEALIYMPLPHVLRWISLPAQEPGMDSLFGTTRWREARELKGPARRQFLHDLFRDQLASEAGDRLVRSFEIPTASGNGYTLFFTTGAEKGLEVMKDAMWSVDPIAGEKFRDTTEAGQLVIFDEAVDTGPLLTQLRAHFGADPFTIEQAQSFTIRETAYKSSHLKSKTLAPAEKAGALKALTVRSRANTYPAGTKLQFV
jgi:three-Cys-motif partner protein